MRNLNFLKNKSKRCMVAIMSAMLVMTPVCTMLVAPVGIYAGTIQDNPEGVTLAEIPDGETMDNNYGIITVNNGTISNNEGEVTTNGYSGVIIENAGTVSTNYYEVQNNFGTVNENFCRINNNVGEVTNNYSSVEDNWGTVTSATYPDSVGSAVQTNHASGTVTGECELVNNYGTVTGEKVMVDNDHPGSEDPNPNAPVRQFNAPAQQDNTVVQEDIPVIENPGVISILTEEEARISATESEIYTRMANRISAEATKNPDDTNIYIDMGSQTSYTVSDVMAMCETQPGITKTFNTGKHYLEIPPITDMEEYKRCLEILKAETGSQAGMARLGEIFKSVGFNYWCDKGASTATIISNPITVVSSVYADEKGYVLNAEEQAVVATTPEQAVGLATGVSFEATGLSFITAPNSAENIADAKADILKKDTVQKALTDNGLSGEIVNAGILARSDGKSARTSVSISPSGLVKGDKTIILYYLPGNSTPHIVIPRWKKGTLFVKLPMPCEYYIVK